MRIRIHRAIVALLLASAFTALAGGGTTSVGTNSTVLLGTPDRAGRTPAWAASTAYAQGAVAWSQGAFYVALVAGTSTNVASGAPRGIEDSTDGSVTWRHMLPGARGGLFLANAGTNDVTITWDPVTIPGAGLVLGAGEKLIFSGQLDTPQSRVSAATGAGTSSVVAWEW